MKSIVGTIMVLAVFGSAMANSVMAQGGVVVEARTEIETDTLEAAVSTPSPEPPPPPALPGASVTPASVEPEVAVFDDLMTSVAQEPTFFSIRTGTTPSSCKVLLIPNMEIKTEDVAAITQDMQVMSHIFNKIFKGPRLIGEVFVDYGDFFGRGSRATQAIYLQGYGMLFVMEVDFPFSPPAESKEKPEDTKEADSVWNQAKQEMFHPTKTVGRPPDSEEIYDAEKVEELKSRLIKALKHSANIRNLKSDEWLVLTVIGKSGYGGAGYGGVSAVNTRTYSSAGGGHYRTTRVVPVGVGIASSTVLTIRAKKSDVDMFAKGDLDYDKFREKVQILKYPSLGQQVGRVRLTLPRQPVESTPETVAPESMNR